MTTLALDVTGVSVAFGGLLAIDRVDLRVPAGQIYAVIGPNGAGKTSLFNAITGIHPPRCGRILVAGRNVVRPWNRTARLACLGCAVLGAFAGLLSVNANSWWGAVINDHAGTSPFPWSAAWTTLLDQLTPSGWTVIPALVGALLGGAGSWFLWRSARHSPEQVARCEVARTFQNIRLFKQLSVRDNVLVGLDRRLSYGLWQAALRLPGRARDEASAAQDASAMLALVGLTGQDSQPAGTLSYGHQRRLEIARALASGAKLLLLDEPAAGMNPQESAELMTLIRAIRERGITVLLIEHDMRVVMGISDRICVLHQGRVIAEGTPAQVRADPQVIAAYLGTPAADEP